MPRAGALLSALLIAAALGAVGGASAQTMTHPGTKRAPSLPATVKSPAQMRVGPCGAYGAGFVQVPGSDACIKVGGGVTTDATGMGH